MPASPRPVTSGNRLLRRSDHLGRIGLTLTRPTALQGGSGKEITALPVGLVVWLVVVLLWLVATPSGSGNARLELTLPGKPREIVGNFLLLAPLAIVWATTMVSGGWGGPIIRLGAGLAIISSAIELAQGVLPMIGRVVSPYDVLLNVSGGLIAAVAAMWLKQRRYRARPILAALAAVLFLTILASMVHANRTASVLFRLRGWNPEYAVAVGDEVGGRRAYDGRVSNATICAGRADERICLGAGAGQGRRRRLADLAERTQFVEVAADVVARSEVQFGPTRIVTFSQNRSLRNLTLGQQWRALVFRARTLRSGPNGNRLEFYLPDAIRAGTRAHVSATYDRGLITMSSRSEAEVVSAAYPTDLLSSWWLVRPRKRPVEPRHLALASSVGALVLFLPVGLAVSGALSLPRVLSLLTAAGAAVGMLYLLNGLVGAVAAPQGALLVAAAAMMGSWTATLYWRPRLRARRGGR